MTRNTRPAFVWCVLAAFCVAASADADDRLKGEAAKALRRSVDFFHHQVASHGGYLYRYSADLSKREGEEKAGPDVAWVQPPGTPAVGMAYVDAYQRTSEKYLLEAARDAGECLIRGQLKSGGWAALIDLSEEGRKKYAYRVDPDRQKRGNNWTTFDDNKTQSAVRFLIELDQALKFQDAKVHDAAMFALDSILKAQFPNGAWPQGYQDFPDPNQHPVKKASYPKEWPRTHPAADYRLHYTFNDNSVADTIDLLCMASRVYDDNKYRRAAIKAGEFILLAQMPEPQPAWAQQYDVEMHPVWARRFEPPAISGGESQGILKTLQKLYVETEDRRFLDAVPKALAYLRKSQLPDGKLARFYELQTNKPLYFTKEYVLTYDDGDVPTHYGFKVSSNVDKIERDQQKLANMSAAELLKARQRGQAPRSFSRPGDSEVRKVISGLDERGAWLEEGRMRNFGSSDTTRQVIDTRTFIKNIDVLSRYLAHENL